MKIIIQNLKEWKRLFGKDISLNMVCLAEYIGTEDETIVIKDRVGGYMTHTIDGEPLNGILAK